MNSGAFHGFNLRFGGATATADNGTGVPHPPPRRSGQSGNESDHRFAHFFRHKCRSLLLGSAADFTDHHDPLSIRILFKGIQAVNEIGADNRITADADTGTISIDSLRILKVTGGDFNTESGIILNKGTVTANETTIHLPDVYTNKGSISLDESILNCAASLTNQGIFTAYDTEFNGSGFFTNDSTLTTRTVVFNMGLDNSGLATMYGKSIFNDTLITQASSTMNIRSHSNVPFRFDPVKGFVNKGLINCNTGAADYYGGGQLTSSEGMLINDVGGTINFTGGGSSYYSGMYAPMVNHGEISVSHNTRFSHASADFVNMGSINVLKGWKLEFQGASFTNQSGGLKMGLAIQLLRSPTNFLWPKI